LWKTPVDFTIITRPADMIKCKVVIRHSPQADEPHRALALTLFGMIVLALLFDLSVLYRGLFQPLLDLYSFRQTQTALTAYWLMQGGPILAYETPIGGYPWSIPLEFPVYQIIVAGLSSSGMPLDAAGRIVSFSFFLACLWPLHILFRALCVNKVAFLYVTILFLLSPVYLFWGRTFMIETCALFFCLCWLAYFARYLIEPRTTLFATAVVTGSLGVLAKTTTFATFAALGAILLLKQSYSAFRNSEGKLRPLIFAAIALATPFLIAMLWTSYSDMLKLNNELGVQLTSQNLTEWIFGTWDQRIGLTLWRDAILRSVLDTFGYGAVPALAIIAATTVRSKYGFFALLAISAYLLPFVLFTNVHILHSYYQTANAIFLIAASGFGLAALATDFRRASFTIVFLIFIIGGQLVYFHSIYAGFLTRNSLDDPILGPTFRIAKVAKIETKLDTSLIVIGDRWSSRIPYYAERRSLVLSELMPISFWKKALAMPQRFLDDVPLGAIVYCADTAPQDSERKALVEEFISGRALIADAGRCKLLASTKS
jgi:hypothetical protein